LKLFFDDRALADLEGIYRWIAKDNPTAAKGHVALFDCGSDGVNQAP
jgi:plasmid stabilization system protein ParE